MLRKVVFLRSSASHFAETKVGRTEGYSLNLNFRHKTPSQSLRIKSNI